MQALAYNFFIWNLESNKGLQQITNVLGSSHAGSTEDIPADKTESGYSAGWQASLRRLDLRWLSSVLGDKGRMQTEERPNKEHYEVPLGQVDEEHNSSMDKIKDSESFVTSDIKKRRGRAAPPGRCHICNRVDTPEWRGGPDGPRTLCNACGLRMLLYDGIMQALLTTL